MNPYVNALITTLLQSIPLACAALACGWGISLIFDRESEDLANFDVVNSDLENT